MEKICEMVDWRSNRRILPMWLPGLGAWSRRTQKRVIRRLWVHILQKIPPGFCLRKCTLKVVGVQSPLRREVSRC
ncbi:Protein of unknown function [Gryllus bimaculatus]|nr:Protein of unknown function [Gryllus bimaculatus]